MDFGHGFCFPWRIHVWYTYLHEWLILMGTMYVDNGKYTIVSCILWVLVTLCTAWISSFLLGKLVGEISMHYIRSCWRSVWESKPWWIFRIACFEVTFWRCPRVGLMVSIPSPGIGLVREKPYEWRSQPVHKLEMALYNGITRLFHPYKRSYFTPTYVTGFPGGRPPWGMTDHLPGTSPQMWRSQSLQRKSPEIAWATVRLMQMRSAFGQDTPLKLNISKIATIWNQLILSC